MAKYNDTKFYWLQLKEDFFEDDAIDWLESQDNGPAYALFYLKLCLKSLKTNGVLIRRVGEMLIPYDAAALGKLTRTPTDTVKAAMVYLSQCGLIKMLENGELYLSKVETMIGSQSVSAFKKQQQRMLKHPETPAALPKGVENKGALTDGGQEVDKGVDKCPPELEIELEIEIEKEKDSFVANATAADAAPWIEDEKEGESALTLTPSNSNHNDSKVVPYQEIVSLYNATCKSLPKARGLNDRRKATIRARWKESGEKLETFRELFQKAEASYWLTGDNPTKWRANFDWLLTPSKFLRILEGGYPAKTNTKTNTKGDTDNDRNHHEQQDAKEANRKVLNAFQERLERAKAARGVYEHHPQ